MENIRNIATPKLKEKFKDYGNGFDENCRERIPHRK
jgi:hypothetical protein